MSVHEIRVPDLGGADEVEIIEMMVKPGDRVAEEDPILEVESDKATVELPAPVAGIVKSLEVKTGDSLREGDLVGTIETDADDASQDSGEASTLAEDEQETQGETPEPAPRKESAAATGRTETVRVPDLGGAEDVPVVEVQVRPGDTVEVEDPLVTVESDKASMEIPSPYAGTIESVAVSENDTVSEGDVLATLKVTAGGGAQQASDSRESTETEESAQPVKQAPEKPGTSKTPAPAAPAVEASGAGGKGVHAGPAVRKIAREFGVELAQVPGSGPKGRILKEDVQTWVKRRLEGGGAGVAASGAGIPEVELPDFSQFGPIERQPMNRIQKLTAAGMQRSWLNVPHVTQFEDVDITELETFRKAHRDEAQARGVKLTPVAFLIKACAYALRAYPQFNVSLDMNNQELIRKKYCHIGVAVDTPAGLVVPVIRDADTKSIWQLAEEAQSLAEKARDKKLSSDDMKGACFTITSLGGLGGTAFTPIVNTPEVAILGVSKAATKPIWDGEAFQPRLMLPLSLSYDHRAINGADAARFTSLLGRVLGDLRELLM